MYAFEPLPGLNTQRREWREVRALSLNHRQRRKLKSVLKRNRRESLRRRAPSFLDRGNSKRGCKVQRVIGLSHRFVESPEQSRSERMIRSVATTLRLGGFSLVWS